MLTKTNPVITNLHYDINWLSGKHKFRLTGLSLFDNKDNAFRLFFFRNNLAVSKGYYTIHFPGVSCFTDKAEHAAAGKVLQTQPCILESFSTVTSIINGLYMCHPVVHICDIFWYVLQNISDGRKVS